MGKATAMKKFTKNPSNTHRRRGTPDLGWGGREYLAVLQLSFFSLPILSPPPSLAGRNDDTCSVARHAHAAAAANSLLRLARAFCGEGGWRQTRIYRMDFAPELGRTGQSSVASPSLTYCEFVRNQEHITGHPTRQFF